MKNEVREFIVENFLFGDDSTMIGDDDSFMESGTINSTGILEIIEFLEDKYSIAIEESELLPENLDSLNAIVAFVERKQEAAAIA